MRLGVVRLEDEHGGTHDICISMNAPVFILRRESTMFLDQSRRCEEGKYHSHTAVPHAWSQPVSHSWLASASSLVVRRGTRATLCCQWELVNSSASAGLQHLRCALFS